MKTNQKVKSFNQKIHKNNLKRSISSTGKVIQRDRKKRVWRRKNYKNYQLFLHSDEKKLEKMTRITLEFDLSKKINSDGLI